MSITGNKGEWSEIYTLFKILSDKSLYLGNENLEKIADVFYPIIKVLRTESNGDFEYSIDQDIVIISSGKKDTLRINIVEFKDQALYLLNAIKNSTGSSFEVPVIEEFMNKIHCQSLKASSTAKTDITIVIHDERTNQTPELGFSIKSQLGNPSTLLNAGRTTNFKYKINVNISESKINEINLISTRQKIKDRIERIFEHGGKFEFICTERQIFFNNLVLIDSRLPDIMSEIILEFYSTSSSSLVDLVSAIEISNPLKFDSSNNHEFYRYKLKRFLTDVALGMMPSQVWDGVYDATGGYLVVKDDGGILCYHIYNKNEFENYLLNNTRLETASSSRHGFGVLFEENGELFMNLNLQIRFKK